MPTKESTSEVVRCNVLFSDLSISKVFISDGNRFIRARTGNSLKSDFSGKLDHYNQGIRNTLFLENMGIL